MGWQDRKYSGSASSDGVGLNLMGLLNSAVTIGVWFGVAVRIHAILILFLIFRILGADGRTMGFKDAVTGAAILFFSVLFHEFGHCFAARKVGGRADEIVMGPLGGLAYVNTPQRPWPSFVATVGGPLVNVVICVVTGLGLLAMTKFQGSLPLSPLVAFGGRSHLNEATLMAIVSSDFAYLLYWIFTVNWSLLAFNLLPIFPFDGGRMFQEMLWPKLGFYKSMDVASMVGMVGGVFITIAGLLGNGILFFIGVSGLMVCYQTRQNLPALAESAWRDSQYTSPPPHQKPTRPKRGHHDDDFNIKDLNPIEKWKRAQRKKKFQRLFEDDDK